METRKNEGKTKNFRAPEKFSSSQKFTFYGNLKIGKSEKFKIRKKGELNFGEMFAVFVSVRLATDEIYDILLIC